MHHNLRPAFPQMSPTVYWPCPGGPASGCGATINPVGISACGMRLAKQIRLNTLCRFAAGGRMPARPRRAAVVAGNESTTSLSRIPDAPAPMLCTLVDSAFDSPDWTFEPKFDGLRILARFDGRDLALL